MKILHLNTRPPRVEMLPLIDIVFLLLVVFIYTMLSMAVHKGMPVSLPTGEQVQPEKQAPISVTVTRSGEIFVNKTPVALEDLKAVIEKHPDIDAETGVLLFADRQVAYQQLFEVLDRIRQSGLHRISLQAETEEAQ
ncbi:MAG: biopolymer transporter ExbD [Desulfobacteraceae bacterium]